MVELAPTSARTRAWAAALCSQSRCSPARSKRSVGDETRRGRMRGRSRRRLTAAAGGGGLHRVATHRGWAAATHVRAARGHVRGAGGAHAVRTRPQAVSPKPFVSQTVTAPRSSPPISLPSAPLAAPSRPPFFLQRGRWPSVCRQPSPAMCHVVWWRGAISMSRPWFRDRVGGACSVMTTYGLVVCCLLLGRISANEGSW